MIPKGEQQEWASGNTEDIADEHFQNGRAQVTDPKCPMKLREKNRRNIYLSNEQNQEKILKPIWGGKKIKWKRVTYGKDTNHGSHDNE